MNKKLAKILNSLLLISVSFAVLAYILSIIGFQEILQTIKKANPLFIFISFLCMLGMFCFWNLRWNTVVNKMVYSSFFSLFPILLAGSFINSTTPGARVGGEPLRAHFLHKRYHKPTTKFLATTFVDKAAASFVFSGFVLFSVLFVIIFLNINSRIKFMLESIIIVISFLVIIVLLLREKMKKRFERIDISRILKKVYRMYIFSFFTKRFNTFRSFEEYSMDKINNVKDTFAELIKDKKLFRRCIVYGFFMWLFNYTGTFFIFLSFGHWINPLAVVIVVSLSMILGSVAIVPGGMGIIETIMISLYVVFGINPGVAAAVAVINRAIIYFYTLILGFISLVYLHVKYH